MRPVPTRSRRPSAGRLIGDLVLNLAAVGGALCLVLVVLAFVFNISLIMFKTGSMTPTIPAGSVAVIRQIPAEQISVGDVVTVDRPGKLPVTHRVVESSPGDAAGQRVIRLKGDANDTADIAPYTVAEAGLVLWHVPGMAKVIVGMSRPWVLGLITLAAGALVTWTFWPRPPGNTKDKASGNAPAGPATTEETPAYCESRTGTSAPSPKIRRPGRHPGGALTLLLGMAVFLSPMTLTVPSAQADPADRQINGRYLRLTSVADPEAMTTLAPGDSVVWQVGISADPPSPGKIEVGYAFTGRRALPLEITTTACTTRWHEGRCPGAEVPAAGISASGNTNSGPLLSFGTGEQRWVRLQVRVPSDAAVAQDAVTRLRLVVAGAGEEVSANPSGPSPETGTDRTGSPSEGSVADPGRPIVEPLPSTGGDVLGALFWGLIAVVGGVAVSLVARVVQRRSHRG